MGMTDEQMAIEFTTIKAGLSSISEKLDLVTNNQQKNIDRNAGDIKAVSDRLILNDTKTQTVDTRLDNHIENHKVTKDSKQFNVGQWVVIGLCILTILSDNISF